MLPVFRLPEVSNNPAGGFLRRLPREETRREREIRIKEAEEVEKMKAALGLTDRELEALEEELLPKNSRGGNNPAIAVASRALGAGGTNDSSDLEKDPHDVLYGPDSALGKQPQQQQLETRSTFSLGGKRRRRGAGHRAKDTRTSRNKGGTSAPRDQPSGLDLPTPRVLRRSPHSTLGSELAASAALSVRRTGEGKKTGPWTSTGETAGVGVASGSILGTTAVTTEQLVAAAADVGMVKLLELRRELGRSVGQVRRGRAWDVPGDRHPGVSHEKAADTGCSATRREVCCCFVSNFFSYFKVVRTSFLVPPPLVIQLATS